MKSVTYILLDGRELTLEELRKERVGRHAGYFCPHCKHEIPCQVIRSSTVCPYCEKRI